MLHPKDIPNHFLGVQQEPEPFCSPEEITLAGLEEAVSRWERSIGYFEAGFDCSEEYTHDLMTREELHGVLGGFSRQNMIVPGALKDRIDAADKRFIELTFEINGHVWGTSQVYDRNVFWYYYRWLSK